MQKNHPKSSALRQTKICMAAAAMVTAAALPGYAVADGVQVPSKPQWEQARDTRVGVLNASRGPIKLAQEADFAANRVLADKQELARLAVLLEEAAKVGDTNSAKFASFKKSIPDIDAAIAALEGRRGSDGTFYGQDKLQEEALKAFKVAADSIQNENEFNSGGKITALTDLMTAHKRAVDDAQKNATKAKQRLALIEHKLAMVQAVGNEAASEKLAASYLLDANASAADKNKDLLSWNDMNLATFADEDPAGSSGHTKIINDKTLEIGSFSGDGSDAIYGAGEVDGVKTRAIGTLRALEGAEHQVGVVDGALNIHQAIEGSGKLSVLVGKNGKLSFVDESTGIADDATNVTLMASKSGESSTDVAGQISFGTNTSAGNAKIDVIDGSKLSFANGASAAKAEIGLRNGGELTFADGASAGTSKISVGRAWSQEDIDALPDASGVTKPTPTVAAKATFDGASAGDATITNGGEVTFSGAKLENLTLINEATGKVTIAGKMVDKLGIDGQPIPLQDPEVGNEKQMQHSLGGTAKVENRGALTAGNLKLAEMTLNNEAGTAAISTSEGGKAVVTNAQGATLSFTDTQLQQMRLTNAGNASLANGTTANEASIEMKGGILDISSVSVDVDGNAEKMLSIGSLTGTGEIRTGDTKLVLGELNGDDGFSGTILHGANPVPSDEDTESSPNALRMAPLAAQVPVGSEVVKVGTGNLTLSGDQSGVKSLNVQGGTLTAAHANALGSGAVNVAQAGTIALSQDVTGVTELTNAGTLNLG
ncbi:hypothetical protein, partial [Pandoraea apista]